MDNIKEVWEKGNRGIRERPPIPLFPINLRLRHKIYDILQEL